eukprot:CAMPEP_0182421686 /NCGR_PEP_ID=MMETSP1167-20130531/7140_1 /TAXON_ID=2988 /ORGANISM="Mallomonas Sp, Strain CCMP3275" /LENGTH=204 /DNA_ID=CAMNT_0024599047 /DNA_START=534 /DNA_END=1148 /DNA_ORIENTATION=-
MVYGPGKSWQLWHHLLGSKGDVWMAELDYECVQSSKRKGLFKEPDKILLGDQSNPSDVQNWIRQSGGHFDVIIDDGGHRNEQISTSFNILFEHGLSAGGLYFIEDLHVGRRSVRNESHGSFAMVDRLTAWIDQMLLPHILSDSDSFSGAKTEHSDHREDLLGKSVWSAEELVWKKAQRALHPLPSRIQWIFCQTEACVIKKTLD